MAKASSGGHDPSPPEGDAGVSSSSSKENPDDCVSIPDDDASIGDIEKEGGDFCTTCHALCIGDIPTDKREEETLRIASYGNFATSGKVNKIVLQRSQIKEMACPLH